MTSCLILFWVCHFALSLSNMSNGHWYTCIFVSNNCNQCQILSTNPHNTIYPRHTTITSQDESTMMHILSNTCLDDSSTPLSHDIEDNGCSLVSVCVCFTYTNNVNQLSTTCTSNNFSDYRESSWSRYARESNSSFSTPIYRWIKYHNASSIAHCVYNYTHMYTHTREVKGNIKVVWV